MSGEPKTHTPGIEAKLTVAQVNALVNAIEQCWSHAAYPYNGPNPSREGEAAMKALRAAFYGVALGVPVVARDEANEATPQGPNPLLLLADAIEETVGQAMWGQTLSGRADLDGRDKVMALLEQVRRLAGGENEK